MFGNMSKNTVYSMKNAITSLGLSSNLQLCLDAGDPSSYPGGQIWKDVSGNGNDFYLGASSTSGESSDPTFNPNENCFVFNGSNYCNLVAGANPTWLTNIHKSGISTTVATWFYTNTHVGTSDYFIGTTGGNAGATGFYMSVSASYSYRLIATIARNGSAHDVGSTASPVTTDNSWQFLALSWTNSVSTVTGVRNGVSGTETNTSFTYSTGNASQVAQVGSAGGNAGILLPNTKISALSVWTGVALNSSQLISIYNATKGRFA